MEIHVDGIPVTFEKCHCGLVPTEADARKAIKERETLCGYCKEPIKVTNVQLMTHRIDRSDGSTFWDACWNMEPSLDIGSYSQLGALSKRIHIRCWEKIFGEKLPSDVR